MNELEAAALFNDIFFGLNDVQELIDNRPLLAHYTSMDVLEKIVRDNEIWFGNPLFMNDIQEIRFGVEYGTRIFSHHKNDLENACGSPARADLVRNAFEYFIKKFTEEHAFDIYIFCLSEHDRDNMDGRLSMWRGYGGQGKGAALVFNTQFVYARAESPLLFSKVKYATDTQRAQWFETRLLQWLKVIETGNIPDDKLYIASWNLMMLISVFGLVFKHNGFDEEREWRIIYSPERDVRNILKDRLDYLNGPRGIEPKLKFKIEPLKLDPPETWTFDEILERVILGPSISSPLALKSVKRMFDIRKGPSFSQKVIASTIPYRSA